MFLNSLFTSSCVYLVKVTEAATKRVLKIGISDIQCKTTFNHYYGFMKKKIRKIYTTYDKIMS